MESLFQKYKNIQTFILQYRNYKLDDNDNFQEYKAFKKNMQIEQYILHKCINPKNNKQIYVYLFKEDSKYIKTTAQFKRLIDKLPEDPADVILISKQTLSVYINKALIKYEHFKFFNYIHKYFIMELSKGPLCSKHTILTKNEIRTLCSRDLIIHPLSLPSISVNDPQNIWVGGELGDIIKIESISEITGKAIRYRIVSPDSGKMVNIKKLSKKINIYEKNTQNKENKENDEISTYIDDTDDDVEEKTDVDE